MGWASLVEDIIKRFDQESSAGRHGGGGVGSSGSSKPSPKAVAERARLDLETRANEFAMLNFAANAKKSEVNRKKIGQLREQLSKANNGLLGIKSKISECCDANQQLSEGLGSLRSKFAERASKSIAVVESAAVSSVAELTIEIEKFKEKDLEALDKESRARFMAFKAYAISQRRVEVEEIEIQELQKQLTEAEQDIKTLKVFFDQIDRDNRVLGREVNLYKGWDEMTDWLKRNPSFCAKEEHRSQDSGQSKKKAKVPFNSVFPEAFK